MSRKLHLAIGARDTERGLGSTPGTGTPRTDVSAPNVQKKTATSANEDVEEIDGDINSANGGKAKPPKTRK